MTPSRVKKVLTISFLISGAPSSRFYTTHPRQAGHPRFDNVTENFRERVHRIAARTNFSEVALRVALTVSALAPSCASLRTVGTDAASNDRRSVCEVHK